MKPSPTPAQEVKATIMLAGGHQHILYFSSDSPMLKRLLSVLANRPSESTLLQIPVNEGRGCLCFPSEQLVGLITEPPLYVQSAATNAATNSAPAPTPASPGVIPAKYWQIDNFFSQKELDKLRSHAIQRESEFVPTSTSTGAENYRKSLVLYSFPEFSELMRRRLQAILPEVCAKLEIAPFPISQIEAQLTAHNDGHFYKLHNDNGSKETATRVLTYVYYFYREAKPFDGGELVIYDSKLQNNRYAKAETYKMVEPRNNSIVFFPSHYMHEVLPIYCPSQKFADSRFTINGWIRQ